MKKGLLKRLTAILMFVVMVFSMIPVSSVQATGMQVQTEAPNETDEEAVAE